MEIKNENLIENWITGKISTLHNDVEPDVFVKYVIKLIKKSDDEWECRKECRKQLEIFLREDTEDFVRQLFEVLNNEHENMLSINIGSMEDPSENSQNLNSNDENKEEEVEIEAEKPEKVRRPRILPPEPSSEANCDSNSELNSEFKDILEKLRANKAINNSKTTKLRLKRRNGFQKRPPKTIRKNCRNYEVMGYCLRGGTCPYEHPNKPVVIGTPIPNPYPIQPMDENVYNPEVPALNSTTTSMLTIRPTETPINTLNFKQRPIGQKTNSILVRKIPTGFNNIFKVNEFFNQFGDIKNIQVNFENCPDTALVTFEKIESATKAFKSKQPIFENRFVFLSWYNNNNNNKIPRISSPTTIIPQLKQNSPTTQPIIQPNAKPVQRSEARRLNPKSMSISKNPSKIAKQIAKPIFNGKSSPSAKESSVLNLKTNLYLKISEQIKLLLKLAQAQPERSAEKIRLMNNIKKLQNDLEKIGYDISRIYNQTVVKRNKKNVP